MSIFSNLADLRIASVVVGSLAFFYLYYYFAHSSFLKNKIYRKSTGNHSELWLFLGRKLSGVVFLGILPALFYGFLLKETFGKFGFTVTHFFANFYIITGLTLIIAFLLYIRHKKNPYDNTLQIKTKQWNYSLFTFNLIGWSFYLLAYEFLFRGILLFECYESFGFWPALAINITIYSAIHMVNGKEQALGALLFGTIACYLTLAKGTILIPVFMHISLSGFSNYYSIKFNPNINFVSFNPLKSKKL